MRFSSLVATLATAFTTAVSAQQQQQQPMTANDVVRNIESLTTKSSSIIPSAQQLSAFNAPLLLVGQGPWPVCAFCLPAFPRKPNA